MRDREPGEPVLDEALSAPAADLVRVSALFEGHWPSCFASLQARSPDGCVAAGTACECRLDGRGRALSSMDVLGAAAISYLCGYGVMSAMAAVVVNPRGLLWGTILGRHASILLDLAIRYRQPRRGS